MTQQIYQIANRGAIRNGRAEAVPPYQGGQFTT
jgi:hypothetical protein